MFLKHYYFRNISNQYTCSQFSFSICTITEATTLTALFGGLLETFVRLLRAFSEKYAMQCNKYQAFALITNTTDIFASSTNCSIWLH